MLVGEVVDFEGVFLGVEEFPFSTIGGGEGPLRGADGAVVHVLEEERGFSLDWLAVEKGEVVKKGGHDVDDMHRSVNDAAFLLDSFWPVSDGSGGDAAAVLADFVEPPGSDAGVGPAVAGLVVGAGVAGEETAFEHGLVDNREWVGAVVTEEEDEGVVELPGFFESVNEAADSLVHALDHGGVGGHAKVFEVFLFPAERVPGREVFGVGRKGCVFWEEAEFFLAGEAGFACGLPTGEILSAMAENVCFGCLERIVGSLEAEVEEEGLVGFSGNEVDGAVGEGVAGIVVGAEVGEGLAIEAVGFGAGEVVGEAVEKSKEVIEAAIHGMAGEVPLADEGGAVVLFFEGLGKEFGLLEFREGPGPPLAGEEGSAGDDAHAAVVKTRQTGAVRGELIERAGGDFSAEARGVGVAHIIGEDDDEVGFFSKGQGWQEEKKQELADHERSTVTIRFLSSFPFSAKL